MLIEVPPLRARAQDVPALVSHFVAVLGQGPGMSPKPFSGEALRRMQRRYWPGNVRELRNAVERLLILSPGAEVTGDEVDQLLPADVGPPVDPVKLANEAGDQSFMEFREDAERAFIVSRLREHFWNVAETARVLGMPRSNLYSKIEKYGIERER
jgi:two-component system nitrogen regulation response regulator NtrX